jgi:hypothetical protein
MLWPSERKPEDGNNEWYKPVEMKPEKDEDGNQLSWWEGIENE